MRTANDLPVKQFVRVGVGSPGLSPSLRLFLSLSSAISLRLPFCFPSSPSRALPPLVSPWSVFSRPPRRILLPRLSPSLYVLVFSSSSSSTPPTQPLPSPLPLPRRLHLTSTYLYPSTLPCFSLVLCLHLSLSVLSPPPSPLASIVLSLSSSRTSTLSASVRT